MNRNIPLIVAVGVGVMSGFYIWEPTLKKYQRESKGTWQYEVVQQTRAEEMNRHADEVAEATGASNIASSTIPATPSTATPPPATGSKDSTEKVPGFDSKST
ncbi:hypothetical protein BC939DRAFT_488518 [Gamsiella multidivaricata]|uniref:uncharacterized protein n=1 Tax=Gamsiella multidivaricata TaxID=101098 RepID=UPI00221E57B3|nr:uncharacterized protein BC939DRAFT_488518 [Gamsiella multidivaricata]KAG0368037.1 hypothetical protein BGZ54_002801 [Gamsiella multidivaricata]KAI7832617.1 hypothetical protein BC939DRAFT_488518 [Gamsiella multidivaricata]